MNLSICLEGASSQHRVLSSSKLHGDRNYEKCYVGLGRAVSYPTRGYEDYLHSASKHNLFVHLSVASESTNPFIHISTACLQVGFLVSIDDTRFDEDALTDDFVFVFAESGASFFKSNDTRHLDETIGDLDGLIKDEST